jgi:hypothetical protein
VVARTAGLELGSLITASTEPLGRAGAADGGFFDPRDFTEKGVEGGVATGVLTGPPAIIDPPLVTVTAELYTQWSARQRH